MRVQCNPMSPASISLSVDAAEMGTLKRLIENSFHLENTQPSGSLPCTFSLAHSSLLHCIYILIHPAHRRPPAFYGLNAPTASSTRLAATDYRRERAKNNAHMYSTS